MKSTTVALGLLAGLASAAVPHHPRYHNHLHWRQVNATASGYPVADAPVPTPAAQTTLTVDVTEVHTITSCASTVTDCPARGNNTAVVTQVVAVTTVVCPVSDVPHVSKSIVSDYSNGVITGGVTSTIKPTGSTPMGYPTAPAPPGAAVTPSTGVTDQTLTMTVGPSSSRSILVTTIKSTYTEMVTVTNTKPQDGAHGGIPASQEQTTTTTSTTTGTRTVTLPASQTTASDNSPETPGNASGGSSYPTAPAPIDGAHGGSNQGSNGECVPVTVTVTQSIAAQTVYVTMVPSSTQGNSAVPTNAAQVPTEGDDNDNEEPEDECPTGTEEAVTATATLVPYPTGPNNGTNPTFPAPTGGVPTPVNSYPTLAAKPRDLFHKN